MWLWIVGMGLVGFLTAYTGVGLQRVFAEGKLQAYNAATLIDKLVDRMLDRDVPRTTQSAPASTPPSPRAAAPTPPPPPPPKRATAAPPPKAEPETPRAELQAEPPERYAKQSRTLREVRNRDGYRDTSRARIDAILQKVGIDPALR